jgi:hypothetical protein
MQTSKALFGQSVQATAPVKGRTFAGFDGATAAPKAAALGAFRTDASIGEMVTAEQIGTSLVIAAEALAQGDAIEVGANGTAAKHTDGVVVGRAVHGGAAGAAVEVFLIHA